MNSRIFLVFILLLVAGFGCKTKTDEQIPDTELKLIVTDENDNLLDSADVYLFDDEHIYFNSSGKNVSSGAVSVGATSKGIVTFTNLSPDKDYYIYASYKDSLSNIDGSNKLLNKLTKSSKTTALIKLKKGENKLAFWTDKVNDFNLPIKIYINDVFAGEITSGQSTVPTNPNAPGVVSQVKIAGTYNYYAKSKSGCIWESYVIFDANHKGSDFVGLSKCVAGTVSFWSGSNNSSKMPITIIMDQRDTIGVISNPLTSAPAACFEDGSVSVARSVGNHTYQAISADNQEIWTSKFELQSDSCKIIKLE